MNNSKKIYDYNLFKKASIYEDIFTHIFGGSTNTRDIKLELLECPYCKNKIELSARTINEG